LKEINLNLLTSFSFGIRQHDDARKETTINLLSSVIAKSSLHKLQLHTNNERMLQILWPINCTIQYLTINGCINMDKFCTIFRCSPYLHTLIMSEMPEGMINHLSSICFRQLISLTIEEVRISKMMDGKRWEEFIKINLPQLDIFEFYFNESRLPRPTMKDLELVISSFKTSFWIEHKKWFVSYENDRYCLWKKFINLYSIPISKSSLCYASDRKTISLRTYTIWMKKARLKMHSIDTLSLLLDESLANDIRKKVCNSSKSSTFEEK
jgi:hypothetical protein